MRKFARTGASEKLNTTIRSTAKNGGLFDVHMEPKSHNSLKVLMFLILAALWMNIFIRVNSYYQRRILSLNTLIFSIFIIVFTKVYGKTTAVVVLTPLTWKR
jgi:uncharacterized protein with von Willebrand factor type A (vWA) domain